MKYDCVIERKKLIDIHLSDYNPRKMSDEAYDGLGKSIDRFGLLGYIVWNKRTGNIVSGHQRYRYLVETGAVETDVVIVDLDGNDEIALNITLNNPNVRGKFTNEVVNLLKLSEAQLGNAFVEIGLGKLFEKLSFEEVPPVKKPSGGGGEPGLPGEARPEAIVTCPKCKSQWKLKDKSIVLNTVAGKK
jgi:hypothetical protein